MKNLTSLFSRFEMPENTERLSLDYENLSQKWLKSDPNYNKQYCNIYLVRLKEMTKFLEERIEKKWSKTYPVYQLHKLSETKHSKCVIIGTLFKNQILKPSILKQLAEENHVVPQPIGARFTDKSDELFIEDELQRYLLMSVNRDNLVTGISCALLGTADDKGHFTVEETLFAGYRPQIPRPIFESSAFIVLVSGLDLMNSAKFAINLQLFTCWLSGLAGDLSNFQTSKIARLVIAGNCVRNTCEDVKPSISMLSQVPDVTETQEAVKIFDKFLLHLAQTIDVDVMPGENDPTNHILPQKPMHYCMFPESSVYKSVNQVSNPYSCSVGGLKILGTSGQPVGDIMRYSEMTHPLEVLECCLKWNHLAPTAPDTLGCYPFYESDPFIIEECPHVFFAGNQKEFASGECTGEGGQKVRLVSVPDFSTTLQACILDVRTLDCSPVSFQAS